MLVAQYLLTGDSPRAHLVLSVPLAAIQASPSISSCGCSGRPGWLPGAAALLLDIGFFIDTTRLWETLQVESERLPRSTSLGWPVRSGAPLPRRSQTVDLARSAAVLLYLAAAFTYRACWS